MITDTERKIIVESAKRYKASTIYVFGSATEHNAVPNDIDIAVKGLNPRFFFKLHADLYKKLKKPVDLVDLTKTSLFNTLVESNGVKIHG